MITIYHHVYTLGGCGDSLAATITLDGEVARLAPLTFHSIRPCRIRLLFALGARGDRVSIVSLELLVNLAPALYRLVTLTAYEHGGIGITALSKGHRIPRIFVPISSSSRQHLVL